MKTIHIAIAIYTDVGRHTAQIFTNQFDDGDVLGSLFLISHDDLLGIGQGGVDGALHRIGIDATLIDADKGLGREADKAPASILQHQFIFSWVWRKISSSERLQRTATGLVRLTRWVSPALIWRSTTSKLFS